MSNNNLFVPEGREGGPFRKGDLLATQVVCDFVASQPELDGLSIAGTVVAPGRDHNKIVPPALHGQNIDEVQVVGPVESVDGRFLSLLEMDSITDLRERAGVILREESAKPEDERMSPRDLEMLTSLSEASTRSERFHEHGKMPRVSEIWPYHPHQIPRGGTLVPTDEQILEGMRGSCSYLMMRAVGADRLREVVKQAVIVYLEQFQFAPEMDLKLPGYCCPDDDVFDEFANIIREMGSEVTVEAVERNKGGILSSLVATIASSRAWEKLSKYANKGVDELETLVLEPFLARLRVDELVASPEASGFAKCAAEKLAGKYLADPYRWSFSAEREALKPSVSPFPSSISDQQTDRGRAVFAEKARGIIERVQHLISAGGVVIDVEVECGGCKLVLDGALASSNTRFELTRGAKLLLKRFEEELVARGVVTQKSNGLTDFASKLMVSLKGVRFAPSAGACEYLEWLGLSDAVVGNGKPSSTIATSGAIHISDDIAPPKCRSRYATSDAIHGKRVDYDAIRASVSPVPFSAEAIPQIVTQLLTDFENCGGRLDDMKEVLFKMYCSYTGMGAVGFVTILTGVARNLITEDARAIRGLTDSIAVVFAELVREGVFVDIGLEDVYMRLSSSDGAHSREPDDYPWFDIKEFPPLDDEYARMVGVMGRVPVVLATSALKKEIENHPDILTTRGRHNDLCGVTLEPIPWHDALYKEAKPNSAWGEMDPGIRMNFTA